jgi:hypothetical protein
MKQSKTLAEHNKWLEKMGIKTGKPVRRSPYTMPNLREGLKTMPATSDAIGNGFAKKANAYTGASNLITGQAYNKGNYVVLSKEEAADPATGKRRV